jgi:hypothetical protein
MDVQNKVSRIVSLTSGEREKQALLKNVIQKVEPVFPRIRDFVNLASDSCTPKFKPEDEQQSCKVKGLSTGPLVNLITPKQGNDFYRYIGTPDFKTKFPAAMMNLAVAMSYLNEYGLMHTDLHAANIAFMNGRLVAHDWGRAFDSRDEKKVKDYFDWAKSTKGVQGRGEYERILPILNNTGYFTGLVKRTTKEGKQKLHLVLTRSWDTLALIGTSEYDGLINNEMVQRFLGAFVGIVAQNDADFSNNLRKIIPIAFTPAVAPAVAPAIAPAVAPVMVPPPPAPVKVKKTRKVKSKTRKSVAPVVPGVPVVPPPPAPVKVKKTRKVKSKTRKSVPPVVPPVVPPMVPVVAPPAPVVAPPAPVVAPVEPPKSMAKSMYVTPSVSNQEVAELRKDIEVCDEEVDELRKKVQDIAALTKLGPRRGGSTVSSKFDRCVKSVRKTVKARNKESAAIGICTKSVLQTRGRTMKRYRKGRLTTQKLRVPA